MKKIFSLVLTVFIAATSTSFAYAKTKPNKHINNIMPNKAKIESSLQKRIQSIAPGNVTLTTDELNAKINAFKVIIDTNNTLLKQVNTKKQNINKLIAQIKRDKKTLTADQYSTVNTLIASIDTEMNNLNKIGISNLYGFGSKINSKVLGKLGASQITDYQNSLTQITASLNKISGYYDTINSILTVVIPTTPSAITTQSAITTPSSISK